MTYFYKKALISFFSLSALLFCTSCSDGKVANEAAHQEAIEMTEAMRQSHKAMKEKLDFMKTETKEMAEHMNEMERPDSLMVSSVLEAKAKIFQYEAKVISQEKLIEQNRNYLKNQDEHSLTSTEVEARYRQIKMNYEIVQKEAAAILQDLEHMKNKYSAVASGVKSN